MARKPRKRQALTDLSSRARSPSLNDFSDEVILRIFEGCGQNTRLNGLAVTCKRFHRLFNPRPLLTIERHLCVSFFDWYAHWGHLVRKIVIKSTQEDYIALGDSRSSDDEKRLVWHIQIAALLVRAGIGPGSIFLEELQMENSQKISTTMLVPLQQMSNLKTLALGFFCLHNLSPRDFQSLRYMTSLQRLQLTGLPLVDLGDAFDQTLRESSGLEFWFSISRMPNLKVLTLNEVPGLTIPDNWEVPPMTHLRELNYIYNKTFLPEPDMAALAGLERLSLRGKPDSNRPASLHLLTNLKMIAIVPLQKNANRGYGSWSVPISSLPPTVTSLSLGSFWNDSKLDCNVDALWKTVFCSARPPLKELCLNELKLLSLPEAVIRLPELVILSLAGNQLEYLPSGPYLAKLKVLDLGDNEEMEFPHAIEQCHDLRLLFLDNTACMEGIKQAAGTLYMLNKLARVYLPGDALRYLMKSAGSVVAKRLFPVCSSFEVPRTFTDTLRRRSVRQCIQVSRFPLSSSWEHSEALTRFLKD